MYSLFAIVALTGMVGSQLAAPVNSFLPAADFEARDPQPPSLVDPLVVTLPDGENATGWLAVPLDGEPRALVVMCHAFGARAVDFTPFMEELARAGAVVVAMEYRGPVGSFNIQAGVDDTVAATRLVLDRFPSIETTTIYGFSMGGAVAGLTIATMPPDTFDYWIAGAAVVNLTALWQDVETFRPLIEDETGGTPLEVPAEYARRSPLLSAREIADANLTAVVMVHAHADPVVSFKQAETLHAELARARVPTLLVAIGGSQAPWACSKLDPVCAANPWATIDSHFVGHVPAISPLIVGLLEGEWKPATDTLEVEGNDLSLLRRLVP